MNQYHMSDLSVGMRESFKWIITDDMMQMFLSITGDVNPLHNNIGYAKEQGFKDRVVYGMLSASLISTMGGCYLPGMYCLIQGVEVRFVKPVYIGDELTVNGEISKVDMELKYIEVKINVLNQKSQKVLRGILKAGVFDG